MCNGRTTLTTGSDGEYLDFPIPSIKAPVVELKIMKKWINVPDAEIPDQIEYQVKEQPPLVLKVGKRQIV